MEVGTKKFSVLIFSQPGPSKNKSIYTDCTGRQKSAVNLNINNRGNDVSIFKKI